MAIAFAYTESTNKVVVTGGTAGTPATFADFVTADRAGADTILLNAGTPASDLTLTYAIRPVEDLAIKVKCVVANKTAEEDYIFITGKDWKGAAQTESIDVSAGDGSYETTLYWSEITTLDCSDNAAGGGNVWADGDLSVTQDIWGVIWDYGNGQYKLDCHFDVGNGSTSTYFRSREEHIFFAKAKYLVCTANATIESGEKIDDDGAKRGSHWLWGQSDNGTHNYTTNGINGAGILLFYGSTIGCQDLAGVSKASNMYIEVNNANSEFICCDFQALDSLRFDAAATSRHCRTYNCYNGLFIQAAMTLSDFEAESPASNGIAINDLAANATARNAKTSGNILIVWNNYIMTLIDPAYNGTVSGPAGGTGSTYIAYSCDIHVADKDGSNLSGATVLCQDKDSNEVFSVSTAADGTIAQQTISYKRYYYSGGALSTTYSPHKFTISKAGYETLVLDAITVDDPIDWHLELLPALSEDDVEEGVEFWEGKTGNFVVPPEEDVEKGVQYGAGGTEFTGTYGAGSYLRRR